MQIALNCFLNGLGRMPFAPTFGHVFKFANVTVLCNFVLNDVKLKPIFRFYL